MALPIVGRALLVVLLGVAEPGFTAAAGPGYVVPVRVSAHPFRFDSRSRLVTQNSAGKAAVAVFP